MLVVPDINSKCIRRKKNHTLSVYILIFFNIDIWPIADKWCYYSFFRMLRLQDVPFMVLKTVPSSCNVFVVSRRRLTIKFANLARTSSMCRPICFLSILLSLLHFVLISYCLKHTFLYRVKQCKDSVNKS